MAREIVTGIALLLVASTSFAQSSTKKSQFPDLPNNLSPRDAQLQLESRQPNPIRTINFQAPGKDDRPFPDLSQAPGGRLPIPGETSNQQGYLIKLDPPGPEVLFRLESEKEMFERMKQEFKNRPIGSAVDFPQKPELTTAKYTPRMAPPQSVYREPRHVTYHRLYFEEKNAERYGWDLGIIQPLVSTAYFYKDVLFLPHNIASYPFRRYDSSAGHCLPGDPVPYTLYPPEFTTTGSLLQAGVVLGALAMFP